MEKNRIMMISIIILLVVLLGTIVGIFFYVMKTMQKPEEESVTPPPVVEVTWEDLTTLNIGEMRRNLLPDGSKLRYLVATYSFEINTAEDGGAMYNTLNEKIDVIRDIINSIVGNLTFAEICEVNAMDRLKEQILTKVREKFQTNLIWDMSITEYLYN